MNKYSLFLLDKCKAMERILIDYWDRNESTYESFKLREKLPLPGILKEEGRIAEDLQVGLDVTAAAAAIEATLSFHLGYSININI